MKKTNSRVKMDELRVVLLGKQGAGKSASGNTLLRNSSFHAAASSERITKTCSMSVANVKNQAINVIDTPGWSESPDIKQEVMRSFQMCKPGPHVILLVLPIGRFTNEEITTIMNILKELGDEVTKYMIMLFTKGDDLDDQPIEEYLKELHPHLRKILELCGKRVHVFNNRDKKNPNQVNSLLKKINNMVESNEGRYFTTAILQNQNVPTVEHSGSQRRRVQDVRSLREEERHLEILTIQSQSHDQKQEDVKKQHKTQTPRASEDTHNENTWESKPLREQKRSISRKHEFNDFSKNQSQFKRRHSYHVDTRRRGEKPQDRTEKEKITAKIDIADTKTRKEEVLKCKREMEQLTERVRKMERELHETKIELQQKESAYKLLKEDEKRQNNGNDSLVPRKQQEKQRPKSWHALRNFFAFSRKQ